MAYRCNSKTIFKVTLIIKQWETQRKNRDSNPEPKDPIHSSTSIMRSYLNYEIPFLEFFDTTNFNKICNIILSQTPDELSWLRKKSIETVQACKAGNLLAFSYSTSLSARPYNANAALCCRGPFFDSRSVNNGVIPPHWTIPAWLCESFKKKKQGKGSSPQYERLNFRPTQ